MKILLFILCIYLTAPLWGHEALFRGTTFVDKKGHLNIGGCDVCTLVELSSSPIYVLDESLVRTNMQSYVRSMHAYYPKPGLAYYASKAMMNLALCKIAEEENMGLDVSTAGELYTALKASFPMNRVIFHGNNKSEDELRVALKNGVGRIVIDNLDEIDLIDRLTHELGVRAQVLLRVKPGVHADTHHYVVTGTEASKFGFNISDGSAFDAIQRTLQASKIDFQGIHCHIGSQILSLEGFEKAIEVLAVFCHQLKMKGIAVNELDFGGGLGAQYTPSDHPIPIENYIQTISTKLCSEFQLQGLELPLLMLEPGRSIVAEAGTTIYRVGSVKQMPEDFLYAAVNGGMADNIRTPLYGAKYHAVLANRVLEAGTSKVKIVGKCCESGDILIQEILLPHPRNGDVLAIFTTGAYNFSMAMNYNRLPIPGILLVNNGKYKWIVAPQDLDDILRNDRLP